MSFSLHNKIVLAYLCCDFLAFGFLQKIMRFTTIIYLACGLLLSSCAYQGTVVRKEFRPLPFLGSLGVEGIYHFDLRDHQGHIHHQMVTADVFDNYSEGDYFNDLVPPSNQTRGRSGPAPRVIPGPRLQPLEERGTHYRSTTVDWVERGTVAKSPQRRARKTEVATKHAVKIARSKKHKKHPAKVARSRKPQRHKASQHEDKVVKPHHRPPAALRA